MSERVTSRLTEELRRARRGARDGDLRAPAGGVRARRGRDALRRRRRGLSRLPRRHLGLQRRALPPARRRGDPRAGRAAAARLEPVPDRAGGRGWPSASPRASPTGARCSSPTRARRRTRRRSSSPASTAGAARSSCSRAPSTAARWERCRPRRRRPSRSRSRRSCPASWSVPRDDPAALGAPSSERTAAVLIEPVQGESGVWPIADEMLVAAREACDRAGALLVFDEIQCGMGRTGTLWAFEQTPVEPDVFTTAKSLASRAADRRLHRRAARRPRCSPPATTARPSAAARSSPRRRWRRST